MNKFWQFWFEPKTSAPTTTTGDTLPPNALTINLDEEITRAVALYCATLCQQNMMAPDPLSIVKRFETYLTTGEIKP